METQTINLSPIAVECEEKGLSENKQPSTNNQQNKQAIKRQSKASGNKRKNNG
jgi:hypothetical protein